MRTRDDPVQKMHAMLDTLNAEIDALTERAENAGADVRDELAELRTQRDEARARLASLRNGGEGARKHLKVGVENAGTPSRIFR